MSAEYFERIHFELKKEQQTQQLEWTKEKELLQQKIEQLQARIVDYEDRESRLKKSQNLLLSELQKADNTEEIQNTRSLLVGLP
jgi:hypothetical protein